MGKHVLCSVHIISVCIIISKFSNKPWSKVDIDCIVIIAHPFKQSNGLAFTEYDNSKGGLGGDGTAGVVCGHEAGQKFLDKRSVYQ